MSFVPDPATASEKRKVVITDTGNAGPPMDFRTPEARKWPDTFIPPETCAAIDDVQNALEHLRDANSQLRHAAYLWKHVAEDELRRRVRLGQAVDAAQSLAEQRGVALGPFARIGRLLAGAAQNFMRTGTF
jgi:hypothetical protein